MATDGSPLEQKEFIVEAPDMEAAQQLIDQQMQAEGWTRISGGHEIEGQPGKFGAWGWYDFDGDGEVD